jgi:hypothetical protein
LVGWIPKGALAMTSREKGTGWTLGQCDFPQNQEYFSEQPSKQPFAREKENRLLGRFVKFLFY